MDGSWEAHVRPFISQFRSGNEYSRWSVEFGSGSESGAEIANSPDLLPLFTLLPVGG